ncbi:unnamed protein product [Clavelina lepadiformis]|uniref:Uncharacterized protein n=1 Tax=Clavelina lepadiformis TaxID=159417 RepID=A0ABP0FI39_CLALP
MYRNIQEVNELLNENGTCLGGREPQRFLREMQKKIKKAITGRQRRWCHRAFHSACTVRYPTDCDFGEMRPHLLPPICIRPFLLEREATSHQGCSTSVSRCISTRPGSCNT